MLTGAHPFDLQGGASSRDMEDRIVSDYKLPIRNHKRTAHLSEDALLLLEGLMERDPKKRFTAEEILENDWVRGKTASSTLISGSDSRLAEYRRHQTKVGSSIFKGLLSQADKHGGSEFAKRTSILEMAFRDLDPKQRGYISTKELNGSTSFFAPDARLSLSEVQQLLSENMVSKYLKKGETVYEEGQVGNAMYFLQSGTVEVTSKDGFRVIRKAGEFFGEEALLRENRSHDQTVKCMTPVHVLEITREYFEKYLKADQDVALTMVEMDRLRQRERAKVLFGLQKELKPKKYKRGQVIFHEQHQGNDLYIMEDGEVDITVGGRKVRSLREGEMTGEHAAFYEHKPYNVTARCKSGECTLQVLDGRKIRKLCEKNKELSNNFRDIILRRDFKKAVVKATDQDFPKGDKELRRVFDIIDIDSRGEIHFDTLKKFVIQWDPQYTDDDIGDMLKSLNLSNTGSLSWEEFKRIFSMFNES